jgi:hypothetical protein
VQVRPVALTTDGSQAKDGSQSKDGAQAKDDAQANDARNTFHSPGFYWHTAVVFY